MLKGRALIPEPRRFSVPLWYGCDPQRTFVLQGSKAVKEKVCIFLRQAAVPRLCTCHHVLGKCFDVILAFWRLILLRAPLDVEASILQSAHAGLGPKERIDPNKITLIKTRGENYRSVVWIQGIGNATKYLHIHLHSVQYPEKKF